MTKVHKIGDVHAWIEQESSIHLKAVSGQGDPVELTAEESRAVARMLMALADQLEKMDSFGPPDSPRPGA